MRQTSKHLAIILTVAIIVLFANLGSTRLWDRDEPRNAGCALEMMQRGDFVVPWFNDELRTHKPVLLYWLIMSAYSVMGVNEYSARIWSAMLALGTAFCTYATGRRLFNARIGLWSAIILLTSLMFEVAAHAATPDSTLIFFCTAAITTFVLSVARPTSFSSAAAPSSAEEPIASLDLQRIQRPIPWTTAILIYSLLGFAILAKGPVGLILPTAVMGMFLLVMRLPTLPANDAESQTWWQRIVACLRPFAPLHFLKTCWAMRPLTAILCAAIVALPWYVWVGYRTNGDFLRGFLLEHNLARATQSFEGHRGSAIFFYPVTILVGLFPWSIFAIPSFLELLARIRNSLSGKTGLTFCACWVGVWVVAFSCASTKLPSYITPCYPALALITSVFVNAWLQGTASPKKYWPRLSLTALILVGIVLAVALPFVARRFLPGDEILGIVGAVPIIVGIATWLLMTFQRRQTAGYVLASGAVLLMAMFFGFVLDRVDRHQQSHLIIQAIHDRCEAPQVGALGCLESSWVFYGRWPIRELTMAKTTHATDATTPSRVPLSSAPRPRMDVHAFLASGPQYFVITTRQRFNEIQPYLPTNTSVLAEVPYFLKNERLVVIGHATTDYTLAQPANPSTMPRR